MMNDVTVYNLRTDEEWTFVGSTPREAVVSAYMLGTGQAGSLTNSDERRRVPVTEGRFSVSAGDWCARLSG